MADDTLLCIFSGSNCIIVDDINTQQIVNRAIPITRIWPKLPSGMDSGLDAVCRDDLNSQFIFFKDQQCAAYNFKTDKWVSGPFSQFFEVLAVGNQGTGVDSLCGCYEDASKQPYSLRLHGYSSGVLQFLAGKLVDLTTAENPIPLGGPTPLSQEGDWPQMAPQRWTRVGPSHIEVGCSQVFWPPGMGGTGQLTPAMLVEDSNGSVYNCTFINTDTFTPLTQMWKGWTAGWEVDAATRLDAAMIPANSATS